MKKIEEDIEIKKLDKLAEKSAQKDRRWSLKNILQKLFGNKEDEQE